MSEVKPKPFLALELRCGCGGSLFVEVPEEVNYSSNPLDHAVVKLGIAWTEAHAAHHQEPKK